jgi:hypothetical protein
MWGHHRRGAAELANAADDGARVIAFAQMVDIGLNTGTGDAILG